MVDVHVSSSAPNYTRAKALELAIELHRGSGGVNSSVRRQVKLTADEFYDWLTEEDP